MSGLRLADLPVHESGLRLMEREHAAVPIRERHRILLPVCCPVSQNPRPGSLLTLTYRPSRWVLEVYALRSLVNQFKGGFPGAGRYPAERNMEGMIQLVAQMCADALEVEVRTRALLVLDAGGMTVTAIARPA